MTGRFTSMLLVVVLIAGAIVPPGLAAPMPQPSALTVNPTSGPPGTLVRYSGTGFTPGGRVSVLLVRGLGLIVDEPTADPTGSISGTFAVPNPETAAEIQFGPIDVFAIDEATGRESPATTFVITQPPDATTWFFAEGSTQPPFDTWYLVQNPAGSTANVRFTFQLPTGATVARDFVVGPRSRFSLFANQVVSNQPISTRIDSNQRVFVERAMYVGFDGHVVTGVPSPGTAWLFAEGSTQPPFQTWLLLQNPNAEAATATITYLLQGGGTRTQAIGLPPTSRTSVFVNSVLPNAAFSAQVRSDRPIIAERAMYRFPGNSATGVSGVTEASRSWFFAEGNTAAQGLPTDTWLLLQNPNPNTVPVTITLFRESAGPVVVSATLPPLTRQSFFLNQLIQGSFGIRVEATADIIAERSMFFGTEPRGSHATQGSTALSRLWNLAEGSTAAPFDEVIALMNPIDQSATATVEFQLPAGDVITRSFTIPAQRKLSILVDDIIPSSAVSARVITSVPTVVERTMFIRKLGSVGGHNTIGIR